jgi:hypothetical protein
MRAEARSVRFCDAPDFHLNTTYAAGLAFPSCGGAPGLLTIACRAFQALFSKMSGSRSKGLGARLIKVVGRDHAIDRDDDSVVDRRLHTQAPG